jgi:2-keto-4-pentenoate hydratase/2-oxohepta-3-ene-1,7-dioic acid hydratase in catechol pathway
VKLVSYGPPVPELPEIVWVSSSTTLLPGDILPTGSPAGTGVAVDPRVEDETPPDRATSR